MSHWQHSSDWCIILKARDQVRFQQTKRDKKASRIVLLHVVWDELKSRRLILMSDNLPSDNMQNSVRGTVAVPVMLVRVQIFFAAWVTGSSRSPLDFLCRCISSSQCRSEQAWSVREPLCFLNIVFRSLIPYFCGWYLMDSLEWDYSSFTWWSSHGEFSTSYVIHYYQVEKSWPAAS